MTPTDLRARLARLGLSQTGAARLLGVDDRTMRRWLADSDTPGARYVPGPAQRLLYLFEAVPGARSAVEAAMRED
jgi:DNA-binding transcriptional regulator YiaG